MPFNFSLRSLTFQPEHVSFLDMALELAFSCKKLYGCTCMILIFIVPHSILYSFFFFFFVFYMLVRLFAKIIVQNYFQGQVCLPIVSVENWKPATKTDQVIQALVALVNEPEPEHPLRTDLAEEYTRDRKKFFKNAEDFTKKFSEKRPSD